MFIYLLFNNKNEIIFTFNNLDSALKIMLELELQQKMIYQKYNIKDK